MKYTDESDSIDPRFDMLLLTTKTVCLRQLLLALLDDLEALGLGKLEDIERGISLRDEVRHFETRLIKYALGRTKGHQRRAARLLGLKVTTLNAKIKHYGLQTDNLDDDDTKTCFPHVSSRPEATLSTENAT